MNTNPTDENNTCTDTGTNLFIKPVTNAQAFLITLAMQNSMEHMTIVDPIRQEVLNADAITNISDWPGKMKASLLEGHPQKGMNYELRVYVVTDEETKLVKMFPYTGEALLKAFGIEVPSSEASTEVETDAPDASSTAAQAPTPLAAQAPEKPVTAAEAPTQLPTPQKMPMSKRDMAYLQQWLRFLEREIADGKLNKMDVALENFLTEVNSCKAECDANMFLDTLTHGVQLLQENLAIMQAKLADEQRVAQTEQANQARKTQAAEKAAREAQQLLTNANAERARKHTERPANQPKEKPLEEKTERPTATREEPAARREEQRSRREVQPQTVQHTHQHEFRHSPIQVDVQQSQPAKVNIAVEPIQIGVKVNVEEEAQRRAEPQPHAQEEQPRESWLKRNWKWLLALLLLALVIAASWPYLKKAFPNVFGGAPLASSVVGGDARTPQIVNLPSMMSSNTISNTGSNNVINFGIINNPCNHTPCNHKCKEVVDPAPVIPPAPVVPPSAPRAPQELPKTWGEHPEGFTPTKPDICIPLSGSDPGNEMSFTLYPGEVQRIKNPSARKYTVTWDNSFEEFLIQKGDQIRGFIDDSIPNVVVGYPENYDGVRYMYFKVRGNQPATLNFTYYLR